jgi:hypothetical protein
LKSEPRTFQKDKKRSYIERNFLEKEKLKEKKELTI